MLTLRTSERTPDFFMPKTHIWLCKGCTLFLMKTIILVETKKKNKTNARMKVVINKIKNQLIVCVVTHCQKNNLYSKARSLRT